MKDISKIKGLTNNPWPLRDYMLLIQVKQMKHAGMTTFSKCLYITDLLCCEWCNRYSSMLHIHSKPTNRDSSRASNGVLQLFMALLCHM